MDFVKGGGCRKSLKVLKIHLSTISLENEQFCSHGHSSDESKTSISMADQKKKIRENFKNMKQRQIL